MSDYHWNSFTGKLYLSNDTLTCHVGLNYIKNEGGTGTTSGGGRTGQSESYSGDSAATENPITDYLCANTCSGVTSALLHFEYVGDSGKYIITSKESGAYPGEYLGMSNLGYLRFYKSTSDMNHFSLIDSGGGVIELTNLPTDKNIYTGLTLNCNIRGKVNQYGKTYATGSQHQWAAYLGTGSTANWLEGCFHLEIVERNVAKN
ncbi:hypothetical protein [Pseudomonas fluorescens]|uniref:hypothetical protein n=1 Tax=Pseudomonas fluorescens TaxID=294 RepID=UPI0013B3F0E7|nr:hypothetical protein [Pseudomonas fluorescens]WJK09492.1 hypothetical protein QR290_27375 [Pseudomonas fluorescens]